MVLSPEQQAQQLEVELSPEDRQFLDGLAQAIARRRLGVAAVFLLESVKPLNLLASSAMVLFRPFVSVFLREPGAYDRALRLLEHRAAIELLLRRLEAHL